MSKKIIAIALFAVMVLSLVPFANAAYDPNKVAGLEAVTLLASNTNYAAVDKSPAAAANNAAAEILMSSSERTITLTGEYRNLTKEATSDWVSAKIVRFDYNFAFAGGKYDSITLTSSVTGSKLISLDSLGNYKHTFTAQQGGNSETVTITTVSGGTSITYTFTLRFVDKSQVKVSKDLFVDVSAGKILGTVGTVAYNDEHNVFMNQGILFINYNQNKAYAVADGDSTINLKFKFYADAAGTTAVPAKDRYAKIIDGTFGTKDSKPQFFSGTIPTTTFTNDAKELAVNVGVKSFKIKLEDENYFYETASIPVVWNPVPASEITNVTIEPGRNVTIAVGETVTFKIAATHATAKGGITLKENGALNTVFVDGMKVKGIKVGTTILTVYNGEPGAANTVTTGVKAIDAITVTVVAEKPVAPAENQYRVLARKLNVRSGPGTNYPVVGSATQNQIVTVVEVANGWAKLSNGTYASAQYLVQVSAATEGGAYKVTASSLNVRAAANGAKIGSLKKGTAVTVVSIADGWAQINYGGGVAFVSALYLAK